MATDLKNRIQQTFAKFKQISPENKVIYAIFIALFALSFLIRIDLIKYQTFDYNYYFSNWYDFLKTNGIHGFQYSFSNYNPPYTYFLYIATLLPLSKIVAIKSITILFDYVLALSVYLVVKLFRPQNHIPLIAALITLFLPTVILNGVFWGQIDQIYVAFMLFSLYEGLQNKSKKTWVFFGIAMAIKLQAIFFAPVLLFMLFKRVKWYDAVYGLIAFAVLTFPPMLVGRSFQSIISIYRSQSSLYSSYLSLNAPNIWSWFPNSVSHYFDSVGVLITGAAVLLVILLGVLYKKYNRKDIVVLTSFMLFLVPFLLPEMHERYFFAAGIGALILAFVYPKYAWIALAMQAITVFTYLPYLFNLDTIPMYMLAIFVMVLTYIVGWLYFKRPTHKQPLIDHDKS